MLSIEDRIAIQQLYARWPFLQRTLHFETPSSNVTPRQGEHE